MHTMTSLSRATGVNPSTIRTWERRYGVPSPSREANGRRRYSDAEVARVHLILSLLATGDQISDLSKLSIEELSDRVDRHRHSEPAESSVAESSLSRIETAILRQDPLALRRELGLAITSHSPLHCVEEIFAPTLRRIGDLWAMGRLRIVMEHVASGLVRQTLLGAAASHGWADTGTVFLFGTCAGEQHEFGALFGWYLAVCAGHRAVWLGPDLPVFELAEAAELYSADVLVLSMVRQENEPHALSDIRILRERMPKKTQLWIGRSGPEPHWDIGEGSIRCFSGYVDFLATLKSRTQT